MKDILYVSCALRDRPFNLQGRGHVLVFFVQKFFFGQHELEYLFFLSRKARNSAKVTLCLKEENLSFNNNYMI